MKGKRITPSDILFLSVSMFIIVLLWVIFSIYHAYATSTISPDLQLQITPINGTFDTGTLNKLKARQAIIPLLEETTETQPEASPAASLSPTPVLQVLPTTEATPTISPSATETPTPTP